MNPAAERDPLMIMIDTKHEKKSSAMHELAMLLTQVSAAGFHRAKSALTEQRAKLKQQHEELQVLKRLRTTANASQCWTPAAVAKGFESFLAQAPIEVSQTHKPLLNRACTNA
ncbi:hypothetical protein ABBQ38_012809 [Trebouxia sp. C0009 RCD-2024]